MRSKSFTYDLFATGAALVGGAGVMGVSAWLTMRHAAKAYGVICGSSSAGHCPSCYASALLLAMGLASIAMARAASQAAPATPDLSV